MNPHRDGDHFVNNFTGDPVQKAHIKKRKNTDKLKKYIEACK